MSPPHYRVRLKTAFLPLLAAILCLGGPPAAHAQEPTDQKDQPAKVKPQKPAAEDSVNVLRGRVLHENTKEPAIGVIVAVAAADVGYIWWRGGETVQAYAPEKKAFFFFTKRNGHQAGQDTTDSEGRFEISNLAHGKYNLAAILPDKGLTLMDGVTFEKESAAIEVLLEPVAQVPSERGLRGRVVDSQGKPASGAKVGAADAENAYLVCNGDDSLQVSSRTWSGDSDNPWFMRQTDGGRSGQATTDDEGRFSIEGLKPGTYNVAAVHGDKGVEILESHELTEDSKTLEIMLSAPTYVEGTIKGLKTRTLTHTGFGLFGSSGIEGWTMCQLVPEGLPPNVYCNMSVDLAEGAFPRLGPLPKAKKWTLNAGEFVQKQGYMATLLTAPVSIEPGKTARIDIDLTKGLELSGNVRGPDGRPLSGVSVLAKAPGENGLAIGAVTDHKGNYTIHGLSEGDFLLEALRHAPRTAPG